MVCFGTELVKFLRQIVFDTLGELGLWAEDRAGRWSVPPSRELYHHFDGRALGFAFLA